MTPEAILTQKVAQLRGRVRLLIVQRWVFRALLVALALSGLGGLALRLAGHPLPVEWLSVLIGAAAVAGAVIGLTRPVTAMDAARLAERELHLRERLSSGLHFLHQRERDGLAEALVEDAARHSSGLKASEVFPYRLPREGRPLAAALLLLVAVVYVPELSLFQSPRTRAEKAALRREGEKLQRLARDTLQRKSLTNAEIARRVAENMRSLGRDMERGRVDKKQAMLAASKLTRELREAQRQAALAAAAPNPERRVPLDRAVAAMQQAAAEAQRRTGGAGPASQAMTDVARSLEQRDYDATARALADLAEKLKSGEMSEAEAKAAAEAMARMAAALKDTDLDAVSRELQQAAKQLQEAQQRLAHLPQAQRQQALRQAMQQAGDSCGKAGGT